MIETSQLDPPTPDRRPVTPAVSLRGIDRTFSARRGAIAALRDVELTVATGEVVALVGPSGCGKSTLLEIVCGLQAPDGGSARCAPAVLMPQRDLLLPWLSALDNAATALRMTGVPRERARASARPWLQRFGLAEFAEARPDELSGGMRQRISFLRSLLAGKEVLALDEPFAALDALTRSEMHVWLERVLAQAPRTVLLVTHDVEEAVVLADRVAVMSRRPGRILAEVPIPLPRPRVRTDAALQARRSEVLRALGAPA